MAMNIYPFMFSLFLVQKGIQELRFCPTSMKSIIEGYQDFKIVAFFMGL